MEWLEYKPVRDVTFEEAMYMDIDEYVSREGSYVCFCQDELLNQREDPTRDYTLTYVDENGSRVQLQEPICQWYK